MTLRNALLCLAAAAVSLITPHAASADEAQSLPVPEEAATAAEAGHRDAAPTLPPHRDATPVEPVQREVVRAEHAETSAAPPATPTPISDSPVPSPAPAVAETPQQPAPSMLEVSKPVIEKELAEVGEVYATGETLIEWLDPSATVGFGDLWERIRAGYGMREIDSSLVQRHEAWYLNRPEYVERMVARSKRYLFHIVEEVEKRGMPSEIALLPMIESGFNPAAYSHMHAAGMWQFIPSTGRKYGLQQTWWYDGRRDVLEATRAALDYLQYLYDMFDDWQVALAAYNCGEGTMKRAIDRNRRAGLPTDYTSLSLPRETRNYLPKLQAVKNIITGPDLFNLALDAVPNRPYFAVVSAPSHIDVAMAAKLANVPLEEFKSLNPAHYRPVITSKSSRQLLVPVDKAELFQANLQNNDQPLVTWQTYQLKRGERLGTVAAKFNTSQERLREVNGLSGNRTVRPGQVVLVPRDDDSDTKLDETYDSPDFQATANDYNKRVIYRVKRGDTLASIARRNGTTVDKVREWNGLHSHSVYTGQRLTIWEAAPVKAVAVKSAPAADAEPSAPTRAKASRHGKTHDSAVSKRGAAKAGATKSKGTKAGAKPNGSKSAKHGKGAAKSKAKPVSAEQGGSRRIQTASR